MPKTPSWKKTSATSLRIECACGAIHEVTVRKDGEPEVAHFNVKPVEKKKRGFFDPEIEEED